MRDPHQLCHSAAEQSQGAADDNRLPPGNHAKGCRCFRESNTLGPRLLGRQDPVPMQAFVCKPNKTISMIVTKVGIFFNKNFVGISFCTIILGTF